MWSVTFAQDELRQRNWKRWDAPTTEQGKEGHEADRAFFSNQQDAALSTSRSTRAPRAATLLLRPGSVRLSSLLPPLHFDP